MSEDEPIPVVIPVFNRPEYAMACLGALAGNDAGARLMPVVVDNGSRLRTKNLLAEWEQRVSASPPAWLVAPRMLALPENRGFAGGINAGLGSVMPCRRALVMHDDCVPFEGWAGEMSACMDQEDEECAVVIPMTNYANEHSMCLPDVRERFQALKPSNKVRVTEEEISAILSGTYPEGVPEFLAGLRKAEMRSRYSPEIASFCMLVRGDLLDKYGLFDEGFWPRGYEDKLWFTRAERDGYVCSLATRAFVHHFCNITSDGPGFCVKDVMEMNEKKYREKSLEDYRRRASRAENREA